MARYNHFSDRVYAQIPFKDLKIGDKFRVDKAKKHGRYRRDIVCIKTSELSYLEFKSKEETNLHHAEGYIVSSYDIKIKPAPDGQ